MTASAKDTVDRIAFIKSQVEHALQRCQNAPYPNFERSSRIQALRKEGDDISGIVAAELRLAEGPSRDLLDRLNRQLQERHQQVQDNQREVQEAQNIFQARNQEHNARVKEATRKKLETTQLAAEWEIATREHQTSQAEANRRRVELQAEVSDLNAKREKADAEQRIEGARALSAPSSQRLQDADIAMQNVLDQAGELERQIATGANLELVQKATATFQAKTEDFSDAEKYHRAQARFMFWATVAIGLIFAAVVCVLFVGVPFPASWFDVGTEPVRPDTPPAPVHSDSVVMVERLVTLATGRLAVLFFFAWTIRYLADLHRAHAEQAIIYRDRRAALGVAELILNATPELDQKRKMLGTLTDVYLKFDNSAFVARRPPAKAGRSSSQQAIKHLKDVVTAVEPIIEVVAKSRKD
jgi:hypothetical protein